MTGNQYGWNAPNWASSLHNFDGEIAIPPRNVEFHDITLRDGEETADLAYTTADKIRIAEALARLGIRRTEVFLTVPGWQEVIRGIRQRQLPLDLWVTWQPGRAERALELGARHVMVWYRAGDAMQQHVARRSRSDLFDEMLTSVEAAKAAGAEVNLFMPGCTRAELSELVPTAQAAEAAGASYVTVVDSQGVARPAAIAHLVRKLKAETGLKVEVHCHNDFGLSVANVLAGYEAGADVLQVSVNGVGYRAGNASMAAVVMALEVLYDVRTGIRLDLLPEISQLVEDITGLPKGYFHPVVGEGAFRYEQWAPIAAFTASNQRRHAFPFEPEVVGRSPELLIGKWSDAAAVTQKMTEFGLQADEEQTSRILTRSRRHGAAKHRPLTDDEFLQIAESEGARDIDP